jgi:uncharacterized membrane protein YjjP (DUF1212 family)
MPESNTTGTGAGAPQDPSTELVLRLARAGHKAGYPTADLEERVQALGEVLDLGGVEVSATPTLIEISLGALPHQRTYVLRMRPAAVDLAAIAELDDLILEVIDGRRDAGGALAALAEEDEERGVARSWLLLLGAYALAGAALTPVLGGGWRESVAAAAVGLVVGGIALPGSRTARLEPMVAPVAGLAASFLATSLVQLGFSGSPDVVTLAALVTFLPGMRLTIGMRELATEHLQSGVANTASALVQLLGLVFGVGVGRSIATSWFGPVDSIAPEAAFSGVYLLAAVAAGLAFTVTLRARWRDALVMCAATTLAVGARELATTLFGAQAAVFVAALVVGLAGGLVALRLRRSPLVFIVPGVLMLVPGSAGFTSALQLLSDQTVSGIAAAFDTFVTAMSIAYGLMVATVVVPGRLSYANPSRPGDPTRAAPGA